MKYRKIIIAAMIFSGATGEVFSQSNDIGINAAFLNMLNVPPDYIDSLSMLYYTKITKKQANTSPMTFGVLTNNYGSNTASNAKLVVTVSGAGSYIDSSAAANINPGDSVFMQVANSSFTPTVMGTYNINMKVKMDSVDQVASNDSIAPNVPGVSTLEVTDTVWARDNEQVSGSFYFGPTFIYKVGNVFTLNVKDTATSISCHIASNNNPNIVIALHIWDDPYSTNPTPLATSDYYTVSTNDLGNWITLPFSTGTILDNNNFAVLNPGTYVVGVETFNDPTYISKGQTSGVADGVVLCDPNNYDLWFSATSGVPKIRLNLGSRYHQVGISEASKEEQHIAFPNPSSGIVYTRGEGEVVIRDVLGTELIRKNEQGEVDLSGYPDGIYFISVGDRIEKLVLSRQ